MKIKCTLKEMAELVRKCNEMVCEECILYDMCEGRGIEECIRYDDIIPDDE